jgi:hydrogenase maturation protein HypF
MRKRLAIAVRGTVQGVGFRPYVYGLASRLALGGFVLNRAGGVLIEVEGEESVLDLFLAELPGRTPPLARIEDLEWEPREPRGDDRFRIAASEAESGGPVFVSPDVATCEECLAELFDPSDRRFRYPFLNCTNCGPRLTIVTGAPYDRRLTTMAAFAMCGACRAEYEDPTDRRFHAQPTACPACGPRLQLHDGKGRPVDEADPLREFAAALRDGRIGALKGLGGYHLVCDARNAAAAGELRGRKHRDEKPFAVMVADAEAAEALGAVAPSERALLGSSRRPIVLLRKHSATVIADAVAPGNPLLGVMLPYTPLHHLLAWEVGGIPLVMTSGNRSDEPIAYRDADALSRLAGIADVFLTHDRPIHVRCEDSVTRVVGGAESPIRRSRGSAPKPVALPWECPCPILAVGGQLKGTFALGRGRHAFLSHHLGDLDHFAAYRAFETDIALYEQIFDVRPIILAHDMHPDYASTRYAQGRVRDAEEANPTGGDGPRLLAVQHHHAHMASCMAERGLTGPVIGVTFDGTGYGPDGTVWGGEFLTGDYREFQRAAHLRCIRMPGGEQAVREPWRMALAHLIDAGRNGLLPQSAVPESAQRTVRAILERGINSPPTSSAGRLFDAVAALAGVRDRVSYEGQAAIELEWLAEKVPPAGTYPFDLAPTREGEPPEPVLLVDTRPLIRAVARDADAGTAAAVIARRFHSTVVELIAAVCGRLRDESGLDEVVLSGGVFLNALLTVEVSDRLTADGFRAYRHRLVPPNDGGLSLGQLAVAAHRAGRLGG